MGAAAPRARRWLLPTMIALACLFMAGVAAALWQYFGYGAQSTFTEQAIVFDDSQLRLPANLAGDTGRIRGGEWALEARSGDGSWTLLDQRSGEDFESARQTRPFRIARPGRYSEYRLRLVAPSRMPLAEIELLAPGAAQ